MKCKVYIGPLRIVFGIVISDILVWLQSFDRRTRVEQNRSLTVWSAKVYRMQQLTSRVAFLFTLAVTAHAP